MHDVSDTEDTVVCMSTNELVWRDGCHHVLVEFPLRTHCAPVPVKPLPARATFEGLADYLSAVSAVVADMRLGDLAMRSEYSGPPENTSYVSATFTLYREGASAGDSIRGARKIEALLHGLSCNRYRTRTELLQ